MPGMRNGMAKKKAKPVKKMRGGGMAMKDTPPGMKKGGGMGGKKGEGLTPVKAIQPKPFPEARGKKAPPKAKAPPKKMRGGGMAMKDKPPGMRNGGMAKKKAKPKKKASSGSRVRSSSSKPL
jgi:hypothetical protein